MHTEPMENSAEPHVKVLESEEVVMEPGTEPLQLRWEPEPPEHGKAVPEPNVEVLQSEPVLVVKLGEEVLEPKTLLESEKSVVGLGTGSLQPGEEPESGKGLPEADIKVLESEDLVAEPGAGPSRPPQSWEEPQQPGKEVLELDVKVLQTESVLVAEPPLGVPEPNRVLKSEKSVMEPGEEPPQPGKDILETDVTVLESEGSVVEPGMEPPHLGEGAPRSGQEESVKVLQSESALVLELREEVPEPQRVLESEMVIELGAAQPQPGKEEPKMGDAAPAGQEAGSAECGPELEEVDVPVGMIREQSHAVFTSIFDEE